jgi:hypothetical protein
VLHGRLCTVAVHVRFGLSVADYAPWQCMPHYAVLHGRLCHHGSACALWVERGRLCTMAVHVRFGLSVADYAPWQCMPHSAVLHGRLCHNGRACALGVLHGRLHDWNQWIQSVLHVV